MWGIIDKTDCSEFLDDEDFKPLKFKTKEDAINYIFEELDEDFDTYEVVEIRRKR